MIEESEIEEYRCIEGTKKISGTTPSTNNYETSSILTLNENIEIYEIRNTIYYNLESDVRYIIIGKNINKTNLVFEAKGLYNEEISTFKFIEKESKKQFEVENYDWTIVYNMANVGKVFSPFTEEYTERSQYEQGQIIEFYNDLINEDYKKAAETMSSKFSKNIFGIFSQLHSAANVSLSAVPHKNGIILFIYQGNGIPSASDNMYNFVFLTAFENKIVQDKSIIYSYYDGLLGAEHRKAIMDDDYDRAFEVHDKLEARIKNGMETGKFENERIQKEYEQFIEKFN